jgi:hypothetical protein
MQLVFGQESMMVAVRRAYECSPTDRPRAPNDDYGRAREWSKILDRLRPSETRCCCADRTRAAAAGEIHILLKSVSRLLLLGLKASSMHFNLTFQPPYQLKQRLADIEKRIAQFPISSNSRMIGRGRRSRRPNALPVPADAATTSVDLEGRWAGCLTC